MPSLTPSFAAQATGGELSAACAVDAFSGVSTDTRSIEAGEVFVALAGPNFDGHDYVVKALDAGAGGAVVQRDFSADGLDEACLLQVDDTLAALGDLAAAWRREHSAVLAAITGSNGKTTTKEMLASILAQRHQVLKTQGNLNNLIGLPLTLLGLDASHTAGVVEMGMNQPGEIARLVEIAGPEVGVVTNVGPAHLGPMGSIEAVAAAKAELYEGLSPAATAVVNLDDPLLAPWAQRLDCSVLCFGFGPEADVRGYDLSAVGTAQAFSLALPAGDDLRVRLPVPGAHNVANALAAATAAWALGQGAEAIAQGLEEFKPAKGRLGLSWVPGGPLLVNDTYNANPASLAAGLQALADIASGRRYGLILGDMLELGPTSADLHRDCGAQAVDMGCSVVLALGEMAPAVVEGACAAGLDAAMARAFENLEDLIAAALELMSDGDVVLIKGSRSMAMERVVDHLEEQPWGAE